MVVLEVEKMSLAEVALRSGNYKQAIKRWLVTKKKSRIASDLLRCGLLSLNEYASLDDGKTAYYNNLLFATVYASHNLKIEGLSQLTGMAVQTLRDIASGGGSDSSRMAVMYVAEKKLGIKNAEELMNGSFVDKSN